MKFSRLASEQTVPIIAETINTALHGGKTVLWLVCGGSNIRTQVAVMQHLCPDTPEMLSRLTILPMDERYGQSGHTDSNYQQMKEAGFNPGTAHWCDVLAKNLPLAETVDYYGELVEESFAEAQFVVGTFGMGADGHTAGVLPYSPAVTDAEATVVGYAAPGFTRMTITPSWLVRCTISYVLAYGDAKAEALKNLQAHTLPLDAMPAVLHYDIPDVTVYNDCIGEKG